VVWGALVNVFNERGGKEGGQKKELGNKKAQLLLLFAGKKYL
jgi:hypothetical protein